MALGLILPDGIQLARFRAKNRRPLQREGLIIHPDLDKEAALTFLAARMGSSTGVVLHPSMKQSYWMDWLFERPVRTGRTPRGKADGADQYFILDARFTSLDELPARSPRTTPWSRWAPSGSSIAPAGTPFEAYRVARRGRVRSKPTSFREVTRSGASSAILGRVGAFRSFRRAPGQRAVRGAEEHRRAPHRAQRGARER